jgi:plasmid maintenance system antidote protein VapI
MMAKHRLPTPPGEILLEEFLKPLGMSQVESMRFATIPARGLTPLPPYCRFQ